MRVMVMVKATAESEAGQMPSMELIEAMTRYNEEQHCQVVGSVT